MTILTVTTLTDQVDGSCGATCSLRDAVIAANATASTDTNPVLINLIAGTYDLTLGELDLGKVGTTLNVTFNGPTGNPADTVIHQSGNNTVFLLGFDPNAANFVTGQKTTFKNLTITGGTDTRATAGLAGGLGGGGIQAGGPSQVLTLTNCTVSGNASVAGLPSAAGAGGAGIFDGGGDLVITNSTFSNNTSAEGFGGGIGFDENGAGFLGDITITNSTFDANTSSTPTNLAAGDGGGAVFIGTPNNATITGSTFTNNTTGKDGGALFVGVNTNATITSNLFSGNTAGTAFRAQGGAIFTNTGTSSISLNTFTANHATANSGGGGAIWNHIATVTASKNRIVGNTGGFGNGIVQDSSSGSVNANDNWWANNSGATASNVAVDPTAVPTPTVPTHASWLRLRNVPTVSALHPGDSTTLTADILDRNTGGPLSAGSLTGLASFPAPAATVFGNAVHGTLSGASTQFADGVATATFNGSSTLLGNASADAVADGVTVTANMTIKADTTTSVASSVNPSVFGQGVQWTATITSNTGGTTPASPQGGTIQFLDGGVPIGTPVTVSGGSASATFSNLSVGNHTITAVYSGDVDFNGSTGALTGNPQIVDKADTSVAIGSSLNPSVITNSVQFTATVTAVAPGAGTPAGTGSVQFEDNGSPIGTAQTPSGGVASITISSLAVGTHPITAVYAGDADFNVSTSSQLGQVVNKAPTTTGLASTVNPSVFGQSVDFTATVASGISAGTITGNVQFGIDGQDQGPAVALVSGSATLQNVSSLSVGTHTVTATYNGDATYDVSGGTLAGGQTVNQASTSVSIGSAPNPSIATQAVVFTATVTVTAPGAGTPTGNVQFVADGSDVLGSTPVSGGVATLSNVTSLSIGTHPVTATYVGDAGFAASAASPLSQVVNGFPTTTTVTASADPSVFGEAVTWTATVDSGGNGTPDGTVQFGVDGVNLGGPVTLVGGAAVSGPVAGLAVGGHTVTATYSGGVTFDASDGQLGGGQVVNPSDTTTGVTSSANPSAFGQPVTWTATVAPIGLGAGTPTGQVQFGIDGADVGSPVALSNGSAVSAAVANLVVGTHTVTATYAGDGSFNASTGTLAGPQVVNQASTTTSLGSSVNPSVVGQGVTFTATVGPVAPGAGTPSGQVSFFLNGSPLESDSLVAGVATSSPVSNLAVGSFAVTATYTGDASFSGSDSTTLTQVVNGADTTTTVTPVLPIPVFGQPVTFTAVVAPLPPGTGTPTGQVEFFADGTSFGTSPLATGTAVSPPISSLAAGVHTVTATYGGDPNFNASTGSTSQQVDQAFVSVAVTTSPNPSTFGQTVTFSATVTAVAPGAGTPTGQVQFILDGTNDGSPVTLVNGVATLNTSALAPGPHVIVADYLGDNNFLANDKATPHHVNKAGTTTTVGASANPSAFGQAVSFTATVAPVAPGAGTPTGQVLFFVDGASLGTPDPLAGGVGTSPDVTSLSVGVHQVTATYLGGVDFNPSVGTLSGGQLVGQIDATSTVTSTANPSVFGEAVTFTVTVAGTQGTPTGTVQFMLDGTTLGGPVTLTAGVATSTATSALAVGSHNVSATYGGDVVYNPGIGTLTQVVDQADTTTTVGSSVNPSDFGQAVQFSATVTAVAPGAGTPGGQVQFVVDGANFGAPVTLAAGAATSASTSSLAVGPHTVLANYLGDADFNSSSGSLAGGQTVSQSDTSTSVTSSHNPSVFGQSVAFTAHVAAVGSGAGTPGGTVQFTIDGSNFGSPVALSGGVATSGSTSSLGVGNHAVGAVYGGDGNFNASSGTLGGGQTVNKASTTTSVGSSKNPSIQGDTVIFTATVGPVAPGAGTPGGQVQFSLDGASVGSPVTLVSGTATFSTSSLAVGNHAVGAAYAGSTSFNASAASLAGGQTVASPAMADLSVQKFGPSRAVVGLPTAYVVIVANNGPNTATGVQVVDTLPAGWTVFTKSSAQGTCAVALPTVTCSIGTLVPGAHAAVTVVVVPNAIGTFTNQATVSGDQRDPNPNNNASSVTTRVRRFGYWLFGADGGVFTFGDAGFFGSTGSMHLNRPMVAMTPTPDGGGYWLFASDGGVFAYGDAGFFGSTGDLRLNAPIVGMASTPDGQGYWLFASDGGVFAFGDAGFFGSAGASHLANPIVRVAATPSGGGYWLVSADGTVLPFGDAGSFGSLAGSPLKSPIVAIASTPSGQGYWLVDAAGGVFPFGDAVSFGSLGGTHLNSPIVGISATSDGQGYWLVAADGGVFGFGDAPFLGGMGGQRLNKPIIGLASNG